LIIEQIKDATKGSYIEDQFIWSIMEMNIKEGNLLLNQWMKQHGDDSTFCETFIRSCIFSKNESCKMSLKRNIKWNDEGTEDIRRDILMAFRELGGTDTHPLIIKGLSDVSVEVRQGAAMAAGERKIAGAVPVLIKILKTADDNALIIDAAMALSQIGKQESIRALVQALERWRNNPYFEDTH
jgi:hypothetical protein